MQKGFIMNEKKGSGTAHSKIILIGEHSVVYGYPAIAIPLENITVKCEIIPLTVFLSIILKILCQRLFIRQ